MYTRPSDILNEIIPCTFKVLDEEEFTCPKHGKYRRRPVFTESSGKINPTCPACEAEKNAEEKRQRREHISLRQMNIGKRYFNADFKSFEASTPELGRLLQTAKKFAENPQGKLVMMGKNGTGKTHLAIAILKQVGGIIHTVYEIGSLIRRSYHSSDGESEQEILDRLTQVNLLVLDEIGRTKGSDWEQNWLSFLINDRHENDKPMILITNRHFKSACPENPKGCPHCLNNYLDTDIISRLMEDGAFMQFTGDDYRIKLGNDFRSSHYTDL
jgi:DNA replication protein DnaC